MSERCYTEVLDGCMLGLDCHTAHKESVAVANHGASACNLHVYKGTAQFGVALYNDAKWEGRIDATQTLYGIVGGMLWLTALSQAASFAEASGGLA